MAQDSAYETELKQLLGLGKGFFLDILNSIPIGILITTDPSCKEIRHNCKAAEFFRIKLGGSLSHTDSIFQSVKLMFEGKELALDEMPIQKAFWKGEEVCGQTIVFRWDDGVKKYARFNAKPLFNNGTIVGAIATFEDITEVKEFKDKLNESEELFRSTIDNLPGVVTLYDAELQITYVNRCGLELSGRPLTDFIGRREDEVWPGEVYEHYLPHLVRAAQTKTKQSFDMSLKLPNGRNYSQSVIYQPVLEDQGKLQCLIGITFDITERKWTEEALREREEQFRTLAENVPGIIQRFDRQLRVVWLSPLAEKVHGISVDKFIGKTNREMGMPEHLCNLWESAMNEVLDTGQPREVEFAFESVDGPKTFILRLAPEFSADGKVELILGIATDITDRKKAEELLHESQGQLATELEAAQLLQDLSIQVIQAGNVEAFYDKLLKTFIKIMRADFAIIQQLHPERGKAGELCLLRSYGFGEFDTSCWKWITPQSKSSCGLALKSRQRVSFSDVLQCDYMAGGDILQQYRQAGIRAVQSTPLISRTGTLLGMVTTHWREPRELTDSEMRSLNVLARQAADMIERSQAEEALLIANEELMEADMRKDQFLGALSHEIRNPLASIRLGLSLLERADLDETKAKQAMEIMGRQVTQLSRLVDDLLDVTRITRNLIVLQKKPVELNKLLLHTMDDFRPVFQEKDVRLTFEPGPAVLVNADQTRLTQVLGNLLHNGLKFTKAGGSVEATLSIDESNQFAVIRIEDDGIGMSPKTLGSLFAPFMQADASLDRSSGGLGLGLALVKGLVNLHGGMVEAESEGLEKGSAFTIYLPYSGDFIGVTSEASVLTTARTTNQKVLVVEDIKDVAEILRLLLLEESCEVQVAHNGRDGIAKAKEFQPDVVLCDIGLPGMDGYQVARALNTDEMLQGIMLVSLTGYARPEDLQRAKDAGFHYQLTKPVGLEELRQILGRVKR